MKLDEFNTKAFSLCGAIQTSKELIGLYSDGSDTLEAQFAKSLWRLLDNHQRVLMQEFNFNTLDLHEHSN
jgi:hypothetical protein